MADIVFDTAEVFEPLLAPKRYKGAYGGRGSGKSRFFGASVIEEALHWPGSTGEGLRCVCMREVQKSLKESSLGLIAQELKRRGLGRQHGFRMFRDRIETPGDGIIMGQGLSDATDEQVKSLEGFHRGWVEEAQTITERSLELLRPTIRWEDKRLGMESEIWFSWNPRRKSDAVDRLFRSQQLFEPKNMIKVRANWSDNPWFPGVLESERQMDLRRNPDAYEHIWQAGYITAIKGAYYAKQLTRAKSEHRICHVPRDPLLTVYAFWDIGGTSNKSDACSIWFVQFAGKEIRVLEHYERIGQQLKDHVHFMLENNYTPANTRMKLPHDGKTHDKVFGVTYESELRRAGYKVDVRENAGTGAAMTRVTAVRKIFPYVFIDKTKCAAGIEALGWYHEKWDDKRDVGLGPKHDWSSHACDSFGEMAMEAEDLQKARGDLHNRHTTNRGGGSGGWMGV